LIVSRSLILPPTGRDRSKVEWVGGSNGIRIPNRIWIWHTKKKGKPQTKFPSFSSSSYITLCTAFYSGRNFWFDSCSISTARKGCESTKQNNKAS
jgi:hypothetical protein